MATERLFDLEQAEVGLAGRERVRETAATMAYEWDLFVSYPRRDPIGPWVHNRLNPVLRRWLGASMQQAPRIFVDQEMESGAHWPSRMANALHRSKHMLAVLAPPYFGSQWCMSEWQTMKAREVKLQLGQAGAPGLMTVIRFFDGETFPPEVKAVQADDYTAFASLPLGEKEPKSKLYSTFVTRVQAKSLELAMRLSAPPQWDDGWPKLRSPDPQFDTSLTFNHIALRPGKL